MENASDGITVHGPVGSRVAANVAARRKELEMSQRDLAVQVRYLEGADGEELADSELRKTVNSISKIEKRKKRVDVDDLTTLAIALKTTPNWLMFHEDPVSPTAPMRVYPRGTLRQGAVLDWANGRAPLRWNDARSTIGGGFAYRETHRPFEPNEFPAAMPDRFTESEQYKILHRAFEELLATGTHQQYAAPMMFEVVNRFRRENQSFELDDWIDEKSGSDDDAAPSS